MKVEMLNRKHNVYGSSFFYWNHVKNISFRLFGVFPLGTKIICLVGCLSLLFVAGQTIYKEIENKFEWTHTNKSISRRFGILNFHLYDIIKTESISIFQPTMINSDRAQI